MHTFTFTPPSTLPVSLLTRKSTVAKIAYNPTEIYISAKLEAPEEEGGDWKAIVDFVPDLEHHPNEKATLYVTQGEFGKVLGSLELGEL